jgi:hypothetical protein
VLVGCTESDIPSGYFRREACHEGFDEIVVDTEVLAATLGTARATAGLSSVTSAQVNGVTSEGDTFAAVTTLNGAWDLNVVPENRVSYGSMNRTDFSTAFFSPPDPRLHPAPHRLFFFTLTVNLQTRRAINVTIGVT